MTLEANLKTDYTRFLWMVGFYWKGGRERGEGGRRKDDDFA